MSCELHRDAMVAFIQGELSGLPEEHVRAHLARCASCAVLHRDLAAMLAQARAAEPDAPAEHLAALNARLAPYVEGAATRKAIRFGLVPALAGTALFAVGLASLAWFVLAGVGSAPRRPDGAALVVAPSAEDAAISAALAELRIGVGSGQGDLAALPMRTLAPTAFVRAVGTLDWDGAARVSGARVDIDMQSGAAAFAFSGGDGRRLVVHTPQGEVQAVGTRFAVALEALASGTALSVVVSEGKVAVHSAAGTSTINAGEQRQFGASGASGALGAAGAAGAPRWLPTLLEDESLSFGSPPRAAKARPAKAAPPPDLLAMLDAAEKLTREGHAREAMRIYSTCLAQQARLSPALADVCRYEMARLLGLRLGQPRAARRILGALAERDGGEVQRQAALALCELDREVAPCAAAACLRGVAASANGQLRQEALQLTARWQLDEKACPAGAITPAVAP